MFTFFRPYLAHFFPVFLTDAGWAPTTTVERWPAHETALVLIDLWDDHWCDAMAQRGVDLSLRVNRTASRLRARGVHVVHSPSAPALAFYSSTQVILPTAPGVSNEGGSPPLKGGCFLALGSGLRLVGTVSARR